MSDDGECDDYENAVFRPRLLVVLEVYRAPVGNAYTESIRLAPSETIAPLAASDILLAVADLLP